MIGLIISLLNGIGLHRLSVIRNIMLKMTTRYGCTLNKITIKAAIKFGIFERRSSKHLGLAVRHCLALFT